jgi:hypothetical protein
VKLEHLPELDLSGSSYSKPDYVVSVFEVPNLRHFTLGSSVDLGYADRESPLILWWETLFSWPHGFFSDSAALTHR